MAMRRPRIKASANLVNTKPRKPKISTENNSTKASGVGVDDKVVEVLGILNNSGESDAIKADIALQTTEVDVTTTTPQETEREHETELQQEKQQQIFAESFSIERSVLPLESSITNAEDIHETEDENIPNITTHLKQNKEESSSFKCPPNVVYHRSNSYNAATLSHGNDDTFQTDLEEDVIQMDLLKSSSNQHQYPMSPVSPMSPSKTVSRQRIRATPVFGQRRNSFVGNSPSPHTAVDTEGSGSDFHPPQLHRRERHYSASLSQTSNTTSSTHLHHYHTPHKYVPTMGRIRTESGCSAFSDSYAPSTKSRKTDQDQHHRALSRRDFEARFNNGVVPEKSMLKMFDLIYYNPLTNPMEHKPNIAKIKQESNASAEDTKSPNTAMLAAGSIKPEKSNTDSTDAGLPVPQLKLNSAGELILDDKSLEIETTAEQEARKVLASSSLIFLDENTGMNGFYKRQKRTKDWLPEETIKFYRCLQTVGTDFSLMGQLFPNRTRRDLKLKFKKEERCNLSLINKALLYPKTFNIDELKVQLETEEREREEAERKWKEIKAQEAKSVKRVHGTTSAAQRAIGPNDIFYHNENVTKPKFSKRAKKTKSNATNDKANNKSLSQEVNNDATIADAEHPKEKKRRLRKRNVKIEHTSVIPPSASNIKHEVNELENCHNIPLPTCKEAINSMDLEKDLPDMFHNMVSQPIATEAFTYNSYIVNASDSQQYEIIENKSLVNLDDGTVTYINNEVEEEEIVPHDIPECTSVETVENVSSTVLDEDSQATCDMDESDIQQILTELSEGTMVLVSTLDPNNVDKVLNEIYMLDKVTGELCDSPLDIPDAIVQGILNVMS